MKPCIIIPIYNHEKMISQLVKNLLPHNLSIIIIDDGSDIETKNTLKHLKEKFNVSLITHRLNCGKGTAIKTGLETALKQGFTHALQIDADGQHDTKDIPNFLTIATQHPNTLISGLPVYDNSIPKSRLYGRKITNFWVAIETWTMQLKESMCGYRIYPIQKTLNILNEHSIGQRMEFDIQILVQLYWSGIDIVYVPTKVIYPKSGISHFKLFKDNLRISWAHTKLFIGMFKQIPKLIKRHKNKRTTMHWSKLTERGSYWGLATTIFLYKILGRKLTKFIIYPIVIYFYILAKTARKASQQYLIKIKNKTGQCYSSLKHFISFSDSIFDKLSVWNDDIQLSQINFPNRSLFLDNMAQRKGGVIFTAHLGNIEIARALSLLNPNVKINAIVFSQHAKKFNHILQKINPSYSLNLIEATDIDLTLAMRLKDKVDAGEFIIIVGDRTSTTQPGRSTPANF